MSKSKIYKIVKFIKTFFKSQNVKIDKIVLFGSHVKNKETKDSDVDIAIISRDFEGKDIFERSKILGELNWDLVKQFMLPFDIVPLSLKEWKESSSLVVGFIRQGYKVYS